MITVIARFRIKEGKEEPAIEQLRSMTQAVEQNEPGAVAYLCHRSADDPMEVVFYEIYADEEASKAHRKTEHMKQMNAVFTDLFDPPVKIERLERVGGFTRAEG